MKQTLLRTAALLACALALTACAAESEPMTSPSPTAGSATAQPTATQAPASSQGVPETMQSAAPAAAQGAADAETARSAAEELKDELEQLSEVSDAEVVLAGDMAAVGLTFDTQYQAGVTDRIRQVVRERLDGVISGVSRLGVTADKAQREQIAGLSEQLDNATDLTDVEAKLSELLRSMEAEQPPAATEGGAMG